MSTRFDASPSWGAALPTILVASEPPADATVIGVPDVRRRRRPGAGPARPGHAGRLRLRGRARADPRPAPRRRADRHRDRGRPARDRRRGRDPRRGRRRSRSAAVRHERARRRPDAASISVDPAAPGQAVVEGVLLARYRYRVFRDLPNEAHLRSLTLVVDARPPTAVRAGRRARRGSSPGRPTSPATSATRRPPT